MYPSIEDFTWTDLILYEDELKAIREFVSKNLKHKDIRTACSRNVI